MVLGRLQVLDFAVPALHARPGDVEVLVQRSRPHVCSAVRQHPRYLSVSNVDVDDVLEDV